MMHPSRDSGPPFLPKLNWFHYEGSIKCDSHSLQVVDMLSEMLPTYNQPKTATLSNRHLNAAKIVTHVTYEGWYGSEHSISSLMTQEEACTDAHTFLPEHFEFLINARLEGGFTIFLLMVTKLCYGSIAMR